MNALVALIAVAAPATNYALVCTPIAQPVAAPPRFQIWFSADGDAVGKVVVDDPGNILDPYGKIVVYEHGSNGMSKGMPPKAKLKFSGARVVDGFTFTNADKVLSGALALTAMKGGDFMFKFDATRRMHSTGISSFVVMGVCATPAKEGAR